MALLQALIIDAHAPTRSYVRSILSRNAFDCFAEASEVSALRRFQAFDLDLVVAASDVLISSLIWDHLIVGGAPLIVYRRDANGPDTPCRMARYANAVEIAAPFDDKVLLTAVERAFGEYVA